MKILITGTSSGIGMSLATALSAAGNEVTGLNRDRLNLYTRSLDEILNDQVWEKMYNSFNSTSKAWVECEQKCHHTLVDNEYAVGWLTN